VPLTFERSCTLPHPRKVVFDWHTRPGAFERLNPPWRPVTVISSSYSIQDGARVKIKLPVIGPLGIPWLLEHSGFIDQERFCDEQVFGPFSAWKHVHSFRELNAEESVLTDTITYSLPFLARPLAPLFTRELERLFTFRHSVLASDLRLQSRFGDKPRLSFLVTGASGLIGKALCSYLSTAGHKVIRLVRHTPCTTDERFWNPEAGEISPDAFDSIDVVVHLAGENIAARRWSPSYKNKLRDSRVRTSKLLASAIGNLSQKPKVFIAASGVGIYGDTGDSWANDTTPAGAGFLAQLASEWEGSYSHLSPDIRVASLRFGTVLSPRGGALSKMLPAFQCGVGGPLGRGNQWMSWIALQDVVGIIEHVAFTNTLSGGINVTAPTSCTNLEFTKTLGRVLHRPTLLPVPATALRLTLGEMAEALLLANCRVSPQKLIKSGYVFELPTLEEALRFECGDAARGSLDSSL
jgi:uncharacterized protein (TIGR01777 family)